MDAIVRSGTHRLTTTEDETDVKGNGASLHPAVGGRMRVKGVKIKSIRRINPCHRGRMSWQIVEME